MPKFLDRHTLTDPAADEGAAICDFGYGPAAAGAYDDGLIMLVTVSASTSMLRSWPQLDGRFVVGFTTAFGDVFAIDRINRKTYMLLVQEAICDYVDDEIEWVLDEYLEHPSIVKDVLQRPKFEGLRRRHRPLRYHEAFILQPWRVLGGEDKDENYSIGSCPVYIDLVGQSQPRVDIEAG